MSASHGTSYIDCARGLRSWLVTLDHKRIGVLYLISVLGAFFVGGIFAMLVRTEHLTPGATILSEGQDGASMYNHWFTLHGALMIFLFIIPSIPATLGNFLLPIMLGAKDLAFPRLNLLSYYLWVVGAVLTVLSLALGSFDTGWTFYTPYSVDTEAGGVIAVVLGVFILGFSSILTGINFIVTVHRLRHPDQGWFKLPLFVWGMYATSIVQVLATPVLGITLLLLIAERTFGVGVFDPKLMGDPVLFQHFFWFYSHPAVYIMILPAMAVTSDVIAVHSRKHIFGYPFIAFSSMAIAIAGFLVWGHHMFVSGMSSMAATIFSAMTFLIAVPSAVKVFNWLATLYRGSIRLSTPMLWILTFIFVFTIGGLTGLHLGSLATDVHLHDTYFVVAHFHYVMISAVLGFMGGIHHWWPKITGRLYNEVVGKVAVVMVFVGLNVTFLSQFMLGTHGMPRRYFEYTENFWAGHVTSTVGAYLMGLGFALSLLNLLFSVFAGRRATANPWGGASLEWATPSPPPLHNFETPPTHVGDPYDYTGMTRDPATGDWQLPEEPGA